MLFSESDWQAHLKRCLATGELLDEDSFMGRLRWTSKQLEVAIAARRIFFFEYGGIRCFPAFFCTSSFDPHQVQRISEALGSVGAGAKWQFFSTPKGSLGGRTPLDALSQGRFRAVERTARSFAIG